MDSHEEDKPKEQQPVATEDAKKFKEEYESLNDKENSSGRKYLTINVKEANPVVYKTDAEIAELFDKGTGLVYFGFKSCPWCRSMIETLISSAEDNNLDTVYYVDIGNIKSIFKVENNKLQKTKEGTEAYYKILEALDDYLSDYKLTDNGKEYDTKEKRLYAPTVVAFKEGKIEGFHEGVVSSLTDPYAGLDETQKKELKNIFNEMIGKIKDSSCTKNQGC